MSPIYPEKQRSCIKDSGSVWPHQKCFQVSRRARKVKRPGTRLMAQDLVRKETGAPKIHTHCLRPVLQAYYLSLPTLLEESCSYLGPRRAPGRAEEPFGGEVKLMPQSHFRSQQRLHSLRRYRSQYGIFKARTRPPRKSVLLPKKLSLPKRCFQVRGECSEIYVQ